MMTLLITFLLMTLVVTGMAIGVICGREPIKGSCGGLNNTDGGSDCEVCGGDAKKCEAS